MVEEYQVDGFVGCCGCVLGVFVCGDGVWVARLGEVCWAESVSKWWWKYGLMRCDGVSYFCLRGDYEVEERLTIVWFSAN